MEDKKFVAWYTGGLGGKDTITGVPARDLTQEEVEAAGGLDAVLNLPVGSDVKLYVDKDPNKKSKPKSKTKDKPLEVNNDGKL